MVDFEHLKGMLWGLVVGDCIGSPIQFSSKDHHRIISGMEPAVGVYGVDFPAGYWTDDSSMAFCVMESLMRLKRYDLQDIANNFVKWLENGFMSSWEGEPLMSGAPPIMPFVVYSRGCSRMAMILPKEMVASCGLPLASSGRWRPVARISMRKLVISPIIRQPSEDWSGKFPRI